MGNGAETQLFTIDQSHLMRLQAFTDVAKSLMKPSIQHKACGNPTISLLPSKRFEIALSNHGQIVKTQLIGFFLTQPHIITGSF